MFIYEFMAGIVDTIAGEDDEETFDPHLHRKVEKPTTYSETMIHLLKGSVGAGVLAMPEAVSRLGILFSIFGILSIGFFATYCIQLLIAAQYKLCKKSRRGYMAYPKSMLLGLQNGPPCLRWAATSLYYFVDVTLIMWQLGICCIYFVFVAENIKQVCDFYGQEISLRMHLCILLLPLAVLGLVKDLKLMTPLSSISNLVTLLGLILVFFYLIEDDVTLEDEKLQIKSLQEIPIFVGTALFALEAVGVVLALEYNMEDPKRFVGLFGLFNIGMVVIMALYVLMGVFGYLKYGDSIKASITLNLPKEQKKAQAAKIIFAVAVFLTFPLQNFVAYKIIWRKISKRIRRRSFAIDYMLRVLLVVIPCSTVSVPPPPVSVVKHEYELCFTSESLGARSRWYFEADDLVLRISNTGVTDLEQDKCPVKGLLAVAVPQLGPFIALFGALCLSLLAMIFPGLLDVCVWYPDQYGPGRYRLVRSVVILVLGIACLVSGCYTSIYEIVASQSH